jgi:diguanylate cyclase (GGDEF)-like protein
MTALAETKSLQGGGAFARPVAHNSTMFGKDAWNLIPASHLAEVARSRHLFSAFQDALTGLANRSALQAMLDGLFSAERGCGLILLDLDSFKDVNDTLGHDHGDKLLQLVAKLLADRARSGHAVVRLGGDEFAVLLPDVSTAGELGHVAESYCASIRHGLGSSEYAGVHASAGAALMPMHAATPSNLFKCADIALYEAKRGGRDQARLFIKSMQERVESRSNMLARAVACLAEPQRITVLFQPKVDLSTGEVTGYEALLRCRDENGRLRPPSWISAALEDASLALEIGERVRNEAFAFARTLGAKGQRDAKVAINVSSFELRRPNWHTRFVREIERAGLATSDIEVEVTESVLLGRSARQSLRSIKALHDAGVGISLDDFGTGFASLSHLRSCPVDTLKIDQSFVRTLQEPESRAITQAIIDLGRNLHMTVIAEGLERVEQHGILRDMGCNEAQGFLYGRPRPPAYWNKKRAG